MKRRRLGQHYLADRQVVRQIVEAAAISSNDRVLEIGTGRGILTREIASKGASFEAYEVDRSNFEQTLEVVGKAGRVHLSDAFKESPKFDVLVASLPYSRSADFVEWLSCRRYQRAVVLLQREFVEKIAAPPGSRDYRAVSVIFQISSSLEVLRIVGKSSFSPPPRVTSVLVKIEPKRMIDRTEISRINRLFSLRRRQVASALAKVGIPGGMKDYGQMRVVSLLPEEVHTLCS